MNEIFESLDIKSNNIKKNIINSLESKKGPTNTSNWLTDKILIGRMPNDCIELKKIVKSGVTIFLSLREYEEAYPLCIDEFNDKDSKKYKKKEIFTRFNIPDFGTRDASLVKSLVDNIINYVNINNKKIMIHCLGGHGRTGMIVTPLIAVLFFLKEIENKKSKNYIDRDQKSEWMVLENKIDRVIENLFVKAQAYIMISLRLHRKSNRSELKTIKQIRVPETHAQDEIVKEVIKIYINNYLKTGKLYYGLETSKIYN